MIAVNLPSKRLVPAILRILKTVNNMEKKSLISIVILILLSSCSFPHWLVSHRHITVDATQGNAPEIVQAREMKISKSHFSIEHYYRSQTLNVSEKSFSVLYHGKHLWPQVYAYFPDKMRRLKEMTTIPPMTSILISFKLKCKQGDTILVVERDVPQINDSVVIKLEIPEMYGETDYIDRYNNSQLMQLSANDVEGITGKNELYQDLKFEEGICVKELEVENAALTESILHGNITENMSQIMKEDEVPHHVLAFYYKYHLYFINIKNDCDVSCLQNKISTMNDHYKIKIKFFENVKQPYKNIHPFALVESISAID